MRAPKMGSRYFIGVGSSNTKTVANKHILAAYRNKSCWRY